MALNSKSSGISCRVRHEKSSISESAGIRGGARGWGLDWQHESRVCNTGAPQSSQADPDSLQPWIVPTTLCLLCCLVLLLHQTHVSQVVPSAHVMLQLALFLRRAHIGCHRSPGSTIQVLLLPVLSCPACSSSCIVHALCAPGLTWLDTKIWSGPASAKKPICRQHDNQ